MNKAMIAMIVVSLGAVIPAPAAQAVGEICTQDVEDFVLDQLDKDLENVMYESDACVVSCDGLIGVETADNSYCIDGPTVKLCDKPYVGVVVSDSELALCHEADVPSTGTCPPGTVGTVVNGLALCIEGSFDPCSDIDCDVVPEIEMGPHHPCDADGYSEDDRDLGGTHVTCYYACRTGEILYIEVTAEDPDADVSGYTNCGGARAECPRSPVTCRGASEGLTRFDDSDQGCVGDSYEIYSSRVTVNCIAAGRSLICKLTGIDCPDLGASSAKAFCINANPEVPAEAIQRLVDGIPVGADSFVSFEFERIDGIVAGFFVKYDAVGDEPACLAGTL